jgi:uncharacterized membrane protein
MIKDHSLLGVTFNLFLLPNSKIVEVNTTMDFYGIKMHLCNYEYKFKNCMICINVIFFVMYHC